MGLGTKNRKRQTSDLCKQRLREPCDIELLSAFLGADKDGVWSMTRPTTFTHTVRAVDEGEDMPGAFTAGDCGKNPRGLDCFVDRGHALFISVQTYIYLAAIAKTYIDFCFIFHVDLR